MNRIAFPRHRAEIASVVRAVLVLAVCAMARTAEANDCYTVKEGTKLYAEVMAETAVGEVTTDVIGWFGAIRDDDPTIWLRFVALDHDVLVSEIDAYVKKDEAKRAACPRAWRRGAAATVELTWPDARLAGTAVRSSIIASLRTAAKKQGRACFSAGVPSVSATVCAVRDDEAKEAACIAIPVGKDVYARASTAAKIGESTRQVFAKVNAAVDDLLAVTALDEHGSFATYVRAADVKPARCPRPGNGVSEMSSIPHSEALLPDGTDAGFRTNGPSLGADTTEVVVRNRTLRCFETSPVTGLRLHICIGSR